MGMTRSIETWVARWERLWFREAPPQPFALLRLAFGLLGLINLLGLLPVSMFWTIDGLTPIPNPGGVRAMLMELGLGTIAGWLLYGVSVGAFAAMAVGWNSNAAVVVSFLTTVLQTHWTRLPLSSANQVMAVLLFCLLWADTGALWSIDAVRRQRRGTSRGSLLQPVWPLLLIRCQVALIYGSSGLWKLFGSAWRDGTAVYYTLNINIFHRFPYQVPDSFSWFLSLATYATIAWEIAFPVLVMFRRTRWLALLSGVALHLGLWVALEVGPFSWVMMAAYVAFLEWPSERTRVSPPATALEERGSPAAASPEAAGSDGGAAV